MILPGIQSHCCWGLECKQHHRSQISPNIHWMVLGMWPRQQLWESHNDVPQNKSILTKAFFKQYLCKYCLILFSPFPFFYCFTKKMRRYVLTETKLHLPLWQAFSIMTQWKYLTSQTFSERGWLAKRRLILSCLEFFWVYLMANGKGHAFQKSNFD